jgi:hypothetical protein
VDTQSLLSKICSEIRLGCPGCAGPLIGDRIVFAGIPIFVECSCAHCGRRYIFDWPAGHALLHPTLVDLETEAVYFAGRRDEWYPKRVLQVLRNRSSPTVAELDVRAHPPEHSAVIVLNCIDHLYGHCLLKLLSAPPLIRDGEADVLLIVQRNLVWLVPPSVRVVVVDLPLGEGYAWVQGLDDAIQGVLDRYETVRIAPAQSQPNVTIDDLDLLLPAVGRASLWDDRPPTATAQVVLVLREDRLWTGWPARPQWFPQRQFLPSRFRRRLQTLSQNRRVTRFVHEVARLVPEVELVAVGLGKTGRLPRQMRDLRAEVISETDELAWCIEYARSTIVVGIHGSHMLLPSAFGQAVVELLPADKLANVTEDLLFLDRADVEPRLTLFRFRFLPGRSTPREVAEVVASILGDAEFRHLNSVRNREATGRDWPTPLVWRELDLP